MALDKHTKQLARQLFKMSLIDGRLSEERVAGVLGYIEKAKPSDTLALLRAYQRLVQIEINKGRAIVEHAGTVSDAVLKSIAASLSQRYGRTVTAVAQPNPALLAGLRVRVGDDVYESSVLGQLSALAAAV